MGRTSQAREQILASALALMQVHGYHRTSLRDILTQADVRQGTFYHFFPSKQALGAAVLDRYFDQGRDLLLSPFATDAPPLTQVELFFVQTRTCMQRSQQDRDGLVCGCLFGNLALELSALDEPLRQKVAALLGIFRERLRQALSDAVVRGELDGTADALRLSARLVAFWEGSILLTKLHQDGDLYPDLIAGAMALLGPHRLDTGAVATGVDAHAP